MTFFSQIQHKFPYKSSDDGRVDAPTFLAATRESLGLLGMITQCSGRGN